MKDDERLLLSTLQGRDKPYVRDVVRELGINEKRAVSICQKWANRGWYNYGVNILAGWLEGAGHAVPMSWRTDDNAMLTMAGVVTWCGTDPRGHAAVLLGYNGGCSLWVYRGERWEMERAWSTHGEAMTWMEPAEVPRCPACGTEIQSRWCPRCKTFLLRSRDEPELLAEYQKEKSR